MFEDIAAYFFKALLFVIGAFVGLLGWNFNNEKKKIDEHEKEIAMLKAQSVSREEVREIVTDAMKPSQEDLKEIKASVKEMLTVVSGLNDRLIKAEVYQEMLRDTIREVKTASK